MADGDRDRVKLRLHDSNFVGSKTSSLYHDSERLEWLREGPDTAVTFYTDLHLSVAPRSKMNGVFRVAWILEPPAISPDVYRQVVSLEDSFDLVLTYSESLLARGPKYCFFPNGMSWIGVRDWRRHEKTMGVSMVASAKAHTDGHRLRHEIAKKAPPSLRVLGRGYEPVAHKVEALGPYRFSVAIENSRLPHYFTEKLIDCFATHAIPIYWGCPSIAKFFDVAGIVVASTESELLDAIELAASPDGARLYESMADAAARNHEAAKQFCVAEDWIHDNVLVKRGLLDPRRDVEVLSIDKAGLDAQASVGPKTKRAAPARSAAMKIVVPVYNGAAWIERCLRSIERQKFRDYECLVIDDASTDETFAVMCDMNLDDRFIVMRNPKNVGPLANTWNGFERAGCRRGSGEEILTIVDGDDWLAHDDALGVVDRAYRSDPKLLMTYGNYANDTSPTRGVCDPFPQHVVASRGFRRHPCVVSCLRTFKAKLWNKIERGDLIDDETGEFFSAGGDVAYLMPLLDMAGDRFQFITDIIYVYNTGNPLSDWRIRNGEQSRVDRLVRSMPTYPPFAESTKTGAST